MKNASRSYNLASTRGSVAGGTVDTGTLRKSLVLSKYSEAQLPLHGAQPRCFLLIRHTPPPPPPLPPRSGRQQRQSVPNIGIILKPQRIHLIVHMSHAGTSPVEFESPFPVLHRTDSPVTSHPNDSSARVCVCVKKMQAAAEWLLPPLRLLLQLDGEGGGRRMTPPHARHASPVTCCV